MPSLTVAVVENGHRREVADHQPACFIRRQRSGSSQKRKNRSSMKPALWSASRRASMNDPDVQSHVRLRSRSGSAPELALAEPAGTAPDPLEAEHVPREPGHGREVADRRQVAAVRVDLADPDEPDIRTLCELLDQSGQRASRISVSGFRKRTNGAATVSSARLFPNAKHTN